LLFISAPTIAASLGLAAAVGTVLDVEDLSHASRSKQ
jgi:hypothetical protein